MLEATEERQREIREWMRNELNDEDSLPCYLYKGTNDVNSTSLAEDAIDRFDLDPDLDLEGTDELEWVYDIAAEEADRKEAELNA